MKMAARKLLSARKLFRHAARSEQLQRISGSKSSIHRGARRRSRFVCYFNGQECDARGEQPTRPANRSRPAWRNPRRQRETEMIGAAFVSNAEISGAWHKRLYNKIAGHAKRIRRFE